MEQKKVNGLMKQTDDLVAKLEPTFKGLPHLPENIKEVLVKIAPWLALIFGILGVLGGIGAMGLSPVALLGGVQTSVVVLLTGVLTIVSSVIMLLAYPKLVKRVYAGWVYMFWSQVLSVVFAVLSLSLGSVLGVLIGFYILFEVKHYYK